MHEDREGTFRGANRGNGRVSMEILERFGRREGRMLAKVRMVSTRRPRDSPRDFRFGSSTLFAFCSRFHRYSCNESTNFSVPNHPIPLATIHPSPRASTKRSSTRAPAVHLLLLLLLEDERQFPPLKTYVDSLGRRNEWWKGRKKGRRASHGVSGRANLAGVAKGEKKGSGTLCRPTAHCFQWP